MKRSKDRCRFRWAFDSVLGVVAALAFVLGGCASGESSQNSAPTVNAVAKAESTTTAASENTATYQPHGAWPSPLDDPSVDGVSLLNGLAAASPTVKVPDESLVGRPVKVVLFPRTETRRERIGLLVAYDSGVVLEVLPGRTALEALDVRAAVADAPDNYTDSSPRPRLGSINGHEAFIRGAGEQSLSPGGNIPVRNVVAWMDGDTLYSLKSPAESKVTLGKLVEAAESVR